MLSFKMKCTFFGTLYWKNIHVFVLFSRFALKEDTIRVAGIQWWSKNNMGTYIASSKNSTRASFSFHLYLSKNTFHSSSKVLISDKNTIYLLCSNWTYIHTNTSYRQQFLKYMHMDKTFDHQKWQYPIISYKINELQTTCKVVVSERSKIIYFLHAPPHEAISWGHNIGFPGQFRNFVDQFHFMSIQFRRFGSCTTDSSFDLIFPAFEFALTPFKSKFVSFKFPKTAASSQFRRCPDRWRIWMLSTRILIWLV